MRGWLLVLSAILIPWVALTPGNVLAGPSGLFTRANTYQCLSHRPPSGGATGASDRRLCRTVCAKQLKCSGQSARGQALDACAGACAQALRSGNALASKPWRAAASCDSKACGARYDRCVQRKMKTVGPTERKCREICDHRDRCAKGTVRRQECEARCAAALANPGTVNYYFESATHACRRKSCGLDTEMCVARKLGGPNATCADVCGNRLRCAGKLTRAQFVACMPSCFKQVMAPQTAKLIKAEARCSECGSRLDRCIARNLGGYHPYCHRNCLKRQQCSGPDAPRNNRVGWATCRSTCVQAVNSQSGNAFPIIQAVDACSKKRCGSAFNGCVAQRTRPTKVAGNTARTDTKTAVASAGRTRCRRLCDWEKACTPNGGGSSCLRRCTNDVGARSEFLAIEGCQRNQCGRAWDKCVARKLGVRNPPLQCLDGCRKQATCDGAQSGTFVAIFVACLRGCRSERKYLARIEQCLPLRCGKRFTSCMAGAIAEPPPPVMKPPPVRVDPRVEKCRQLCTKASMCGGGRADELCQTRCVSDGSARNEFKARARCLRKTCPKYQSCVFRELGVRASRLKCLPACQKKAECKRARGETTSIKQMVRCANRCKYSDKELAAMRDCGRAGCGIAYALCMKHKLNPTIAEVPVVEAPKMSKREQKCQELCEKSESCVPASGGEACVKRCLSNRGIREYRARHTCRSKRCDRYEACILRNMNVPAISTACTRACRHDLNCRPPGEARDLRALSQCARKCPFERKEVIAINDCAPVGCGPQFQQCFLKKSGKLAQLKEVRVTCETLCKKAEQCDSGTGGSACVRSCIESKARSKEVLARQFCRSKGCSEYAQCTLNRMGVIRGTKHPCYSVCRFEHRCDRSKRMGDLTGISACLIQCSLSKEAVSVREDCQVEGCGSLYKACINRSG